MIVGRNFFGHQPIRNDIKTYENIRRVPTGRGDDCITGCLLENNKHFMLIQNNTTHFFHWKSRASRKYINVFHY